MILKALTLAAVLAAGAPALALAGQRAEAETAAAPDLAEARHAEHQACHADIQALCKDAKADGGKVGQCLKAHKEQLSPACREAVSRFKEAKHADKG